MALVFYNPHEAFSRLQGLRYHCAAVYMYLATCTHGWDDDLRSLEFLAKTTSIAFNVMYFLLLLLRLFSHCV